MTHERWQQVERVLQAALESERADRAALLDRECAGDPELRAEVESLLASAEPAGSFLESNALEDATALLDDLGHASFVGRSIGHYVIEKQIGSGGMGEVYLARDTRLGRKVALKILGSGLIGDNEPRARFLREARLASALDHPNVCTVHEVGEVRGNLFIAMQFVEGKTLREMINGRPLPLDTLLSVSLQVADALAEAHDRGIIHRDIKTSNIIVTPKCQAKVLDFGLAKLLERADDEAETHLTMTGVIMGTPASMSPEQARCEQIDHRSDIFSFGCVLYEMSTGQIPFKGETTVEILGALLHKPHTPAAELNQEIPALLSAVIDRVLMKEPARRYQSMREMIGDLRRVVAGAGGLDHLFSSSEISPHVMTLVPLQIRKLFGRGIQSRAAVFLMLAIVLFVGVAFAIYLSRPAQPQSAAPIKSIAVLPFKPLGEGRDEALELGMADTLIARLSSIREIDVRPISAVHKYVGLDQDALAAGRNQRVDAVLDGHIQKAGQKIRVTVHLLRIADGASLWADKFDAEMTDIFAVQDSIAERVAGALALRLAGDERERLTKHYTNDQEAYELYLKGRYQLNRLTDDGFLKAREYFQQAVDRDPRYALAYAGLADAYNRLGAWNALAPTECFPKAREAAWKALELDQTLAEAHTQIGIVKHLYDWDFPGAEASYRRAIELNQSYADARQWRANYLGTMGRFDEALAEIRRAQELDPVSIEKIAGVGDIFYQRREYDLALEQYRRAHDMDPNSGFAHWALGNAYVQKGMYDEAISEYEKAIPLSGDSPDELASLGYVYALSDRRREAQAVIDQLEERAKRSYISPTIVAFIYGALGEKDKAFAMLEKAYVGRDFILVLLNADPAFDSLRSDHRFRDLARRVGLPH